jgi:MtN3 and saliva related transmembrane protein
MHQSIIKIIIEGQFGIGLIINAALYIPQLLRIVKEKGARELSLIMFGGFWFITLTQVIYGFYIHNIMLAWGTLLTLVTCGVVICLIFVYRKN